MRNVILGYFQAEFGQGLGVGLLFVLDPLDEPSYDGNHRARCHVEDVLPVQFLTSPRMGY